MQGINMNQNKKWYFTTDTNAKGFTYVHAYQTKWDPVRKTPRRSAKRYVGRLFDDGRVIPSKAFLESFPQYAGYPLYYGADKQLVDEETYRRDFPLPPGPKPEPEDAPVKDDVLNIGLTWAAEATAKKSGLFDSLAEVFGRDKARALLHLAIYKLDMGSSMAAFADWSSNVYLNNSRMLADQRISELLSEVTTKHFSEFFSLRHADKLKRHEAEKKQNSSENQGNRLSYALDNTSISTYSTTIADADYGHAKRDSELKQINFTFVCDQKDGEIIFAHTYNGAINDVAALQEIIYRMTDASFDLSNVTLVTDRGYSSLMNVQKMVNLDINFIQGVRLIEDSMKARIDEYHDALRDVAFYDSSIGAYARSITEPWLKTSDFGAINQNVHVHLYRFPGKDEDEMMHLARKADEILKYKQEGREVPAGLWNAYKGLVVQVTKRDKTKAWIRNDQAIRNTLKYSGTFVLRSNVESDPIAALKTYRMRGTVENDFEQFKNWLDGDRLRCTEKSYLGKLFVCTLATSLRLMMMHQAHVNEKALNMKIPNNSMDVLFGKLRLIKAEKRKDANAWVVRQLAKKQRELFALLGLELPPKVLK